MKPEPNPAEARGTLKRLAIEAGTDLSSLSRMLRRPRTYLGRFVRDGSPKRLHPNERRLLGAFFRVPEHWFGEDAPESQGD